MHASRPAKLNHRVERYVRVREMADGFNEGLGFRAHVLWYATAGLLSQVCYYHYLWSLEISGVGTLMSGINLVTTILKMHAPGMTYMRMPMFCWTSLASNLLIVASFPILTATLAMLLLDRYLGFHFFTKEAGGNVMMFMNLIWAWRHPEVYILILPAFGPFSEVVSTFSHKPLFGYRSMVVATMVIRPRACGSLVLDDRATRECPSRPPAPGCRIAAAGGLHIPAAAGVR